MHLASALGYFREEGLDVTIAEMPGSSKIMEALLGGSADVGAGSLEQSIQMAAQGQYVQTFLTEFFNFGFSIVVSPKASWHVRSLDELRGATVGVSSPGSQSHFLVNFLLSRHGLTSHDYSAVAVGLGASNLSALEQGRVDAAVTTPNVLMVVQKRHPGTSVLFDPLAEDNFEQVFGVARYPSHVLYARLDWIARNRQTVRSLAKAVVRALRYIATNPPVVIASKVPAGFRSLDLGFDVEALRVWKSMYSQDGVTPGTSFEAVKALTAVSVDTVRRTYIDPAKTYTNEFVDTR